MNGRDERASVNGGRGRERPPSSRLPTARFAVASIILAVWTALYVRYLFDPSFPIPPGINAPALAAITYLFGSGLLNLGKGVTIKRKEDDDE